MAARRILGGSPLSAAQYPVTETPRQPNRRAVRGPSYSSILIRCNLGAPEEEAAQRLAEFPHGIFTSIRASRFMGRGQQALARLLGQRADIAEKRRSFFVQGLAKASARLSENRPVSTKII